MGKIEKLDALLKKREQWARHWKAQGGRVIGYLCAYIPEEIIFAASALPIRIMGNPGETTSLANAYLQSNICPFVRSCLDQGLKKKYSYLDGILFPHACDGICKLHDAWKRYIDIPFVYIMDFPHRISSMAHDYFLEEILKLKGVLEERIGQEITDDSLRKAIEIYNENRRLLKELYFLRRKSGPDISGSEILQMMKLGMVMPKTEHNILLKEWTDEIRKREASLDRKPRIVISGSILDNPDLIQEIERGGCKVVGDDLCMGTRYFWDEVAVQGNPWEALSRRYLDKIPCSCIHSSRSRLDHLLSVVKEFEADGVIYYKLKFCDNYHYDAPPFRERLKSLGIPVLELESEYASTGYGQLKTRIQAFLEMIAIRRGS
jgi:bcr-type benzoyl-CoA reductase subunit C